jgi:hypothetical protein
MKFNVDKHVETLDNDYGTKSKPRIQENLNQSAADNEYEIPDEFKHFTNKVE